MKTILEQNIPILYVLLIIVLTALLFTVSESNQSHYERGKNEAYKECYFLTKPTE